MAQNLGHINQKAVTGMLRDQQYRIGKNEKQTKKMCTTSVEPKHTKSPAWGKLIEGSDNFTVHMDTCSPMLLKPICGSSYFLIMTTAKHPYTWVITMEGRVDAGTHITDYTA